MAPSRLVPLLAVALALSGCAGLVPPAPSPTGTASSKLAIAQATHEYPPASPPRQSAAGGSTAAAQAIRAFATAYINWTARTVPRDMLELAAASVGQARSVAALAAGQTAQDYELQRGGIANSGTVEAVAPLAGHRGRYAVVTLERTTATGTSVYEGLRPAWHVTVATATQLAPGRWVVSGWQPES
jgi:hypothetical protein